MAILKDLPHRVHLPQNLLKPKLISCNKKSIVSIHFNITLQILHSTEEVKIFYLCLKQTAYMNTAGAKRYWYTNVLPICCPLPKLLHEVMSCWECWQNFLRHILHITCLMHVLFITEAGKRKSSPDIPIKDDSRFLMSLHFFLSVTAKCHQANACKTRAFMCILAVSQHTSPACWLLSSL